MGPVSVALLWLALSGAAGAAEGDEPPSAAPASEQERLEQAVAEYQSGRWDDAQGALAGLMSDSTVSQPVQQEARVYLGEILYVRGDTEAARKIFEQVLTIDPDFQVDPFRHPPEILAQFEIARSSVAPYPRPEPFRTKFSSTFQPFGLYHLQHERPVMGATLLVTQVGLVAAGSILWFGLLPVEERTYVVGSPEEQSIKLRHTLGPVCGWSAVGIYMLGFLDAQRDWRSERAKGVASDVPFGVTISGRL